MVVNGRAWTSPSTVARNGCGVSRASLPFPIETSALMVPVYHRSGVNAVLSLSGKRYRLVGGAVDIDVDEIALRRSGLFVVAEDADVIAHA